MDAASDASCSQFRRSIRDVSPVLRVCSGTSPADRPSSHDPEEGRWAAISGRGVPAQARRASGYRSPVSQEPRRPRTRNATAVATSPGAAVADDTPDYPSKRFGLPMTGSMSVAPMGRRLVALIVDWLLCSLIVSSITGYILFRNAQDPHYLA